ncbi:nucleotidyltransferase domain-containing protein [Streptomyces sp. NPDC007172]|uniref:nucleotidyltransferase domain-containing protein n=1 Tax=Streptomyces sp. NPDC007172 TaxID=3364776 RepID=UPI00367BEEFB
MDSLDPVVRGTFAAALLGALRSGCPGSDAGLRGSLARGTADAYSDIDVAWTVPEAEFGAALVRVPVILGGIRPLASLRVDPELRDAPDRRLFFASFTGLPLFWRLDLEVRATSVTGLGDAARPCAAAPDRDADSDPGPDPDADSDPDPDWSLAASALANGVAAVKAVLRDRPDTARGLLERGFARIGAPASLNGRWPDDITRLADAAARAEPAQRALAEQVRALAYEHLAEGGG